MYLHEGGCSITPLTGAMFIFYYVSFVINILGTLLSGIDVDSEYIFKGFFVIAV